MTYIFLGVIVFYITFYIITLNRIIKIQNSLIDKQKDSLIKLRLEYIYIKGILDNLNINNKNIEEKIVYDLDDILSEISQKGIHNISKDKLDFLKNYNKNDNKN